MVSEQYNVMNERMLIPQKREYKLLGYDEERKGVI
jgi:hypothetical protein